MFLLDTNVIPEVRRPERANTNVVTWASAVPAASFFLSAISVLEIELGALQIARRDAAQGAVLRAWIDDQILPRFEGRILAVDTAVAHHALQSAKLRHPTTLHYVSRALPSMSRGGPVTLDSGASPTA